MPTAHELNVTYGLIDPDEDELEGIGTEGERSEALISASLPSITPPSLGMESFLAPPEETTPIVPTDLARAPSIPRAETRIQPIAQPTQARGPILRTAEAMLSPAEKLNREMGLTPITEGIVPREISRPESPATRLNREMGLTPSMRPIGETRDTQEPGTPVSTIFKDLMVPVEPVPPPPPEKPGLIGEALRGIPHGVLQVGEIAGGLVGLAGEVTGIGAIERVGAQLHKTFQEMNEKFKPTVAGFQDIESVGDAARYLGHGFMSMLPFMVGTFGVGAAIRGVVTKTLGKAITERAAAKAIIGFSSLATASTIAETGIIAGERVDEGMKALSANLLWAIPAGLMDALPQWRLLGKLGWFGRSVTKRAEREGLRAARHYFIKEVGKQGFFEGITESTQEVFEALGAGKKPFSYETLMQAANAFIIAGFTGGIMGGAVTLLEPSPKKKVAPSPAVAPPVAPPDVTRDPTDLLKPAVVAKPDIAALWQETVLPTVAEEPVLMDEVSRIWRNFLGGVKAWPELDIQNDQVIIKDSKGGQLSFNFDNKQPAGKEFTPRTYTDKNGISTILSPNVPLPQSLKDTIVGFKHYGPAGLEILSPEFMGTSTSVGEEKKTRRDYPEFFEGSVNAKITFAYHPEQKPEAGLARKTLYKGETGKVLYVGSEEHTQLMNEAKAKIATDKRYSAEDATAIRLSAIILAKERGYTAIHLGDRGMVLLTEHRVRPGSAPEAKVEGVPEKFDPYKATMDQRAKDRAASERAAQQRMEQQEYEREQGVVEEPQPAPSPLPKIDETRGADIQETRSPFGFQSENQERVIHEGWDKGNNYRFVLEGSGDIFRELSKEHSDVGYISEKISRIEKHIKEEEGGRIHPDDSFLTSLRENRDRFKRMGKLWRSQPTETELQKIAQDMNIAMLNGDFGVVERSIEKIKAELKKRGAGVTAAPTPPGAGLVPAATPTLEDTLYDDTDIDRARQEYDRKVAELRIKYSIPQALHSTGLTFSTYLNRDDFDDLNRLDVVQRAENAINVTEGLTTEAETKQLKEAKPGDVYSGKAYRVNIDNLGIPRDATAKDIIDFEADELGNEDVREMANRVADTHGLDLSKISRNDIVWVTRSRRVATELYGAGGAVAESVKLPKQSLVLAEIGEDGVLVLRGDAVRRARIADNVTKGLATDLLHKKVVEPKPEPVMEETGREIEKPKSVSWVQADRGIYEGRIGGKLTHIIEKRGNRFIVSEYGTDVKGRIGAKKIGESRNLREAKSLVEGVPPGLPKGFFEALIMFDENGAVSVKAAPHAGSEKIPGFLGIAYLDKDGNVYTPEMMLAKNAGETVDGIARSKVEALKGEGFRPAFQELMPGERFKAREEGVAREAMQGMEGQPMSVANVQKIIDTFQVQLPADILSYDIPSSVDELPADIRKRNRVTGKTQALYDRVLNKVYIIADRHTSEQDVLTSMSHELFAHFGFERLFGPARMNEIVQEVHKFYGKDGLAYLYQAYNKIPGSPDGDYTVAIEKIAEFAGTGENPGLWKRFVYWFRYHATRLFGPIRFSEDDIRAYLWRSRILIQQQSFQDQVRKYNAFVKLTGEKMWDNGLPIGPLGARFAMREDTSPSHENAAENVTGWKGWYEAYKNKNKNFGNEVFKRLGLIEAVGSLPHWISMNHPSFKPTTQVQWDRMDEKNRDRLYLLQDPNTNQGNNPYMSVDALKDTSGVDPLIVWSDRNNIYLESDENLQSKARELINRNLTDPEVKAYRGWKDGFDRAVDYAIARLRQLAVDFYSSTTWYGQLKGVLDKSLPMEQVQLEGSDAKDFQRALNKVAERMKEIDRQEAQLKGFNFYAPHVRGRGDHIVRVYDIDPEGKDVAIWVERFDSATQAERARTRLTNQYRDLRVVKTLEKQTSEFVYGGLNIYAMEAFLKKSAERATGEGKINEAEADILLNAVFKSINDEIMARGFRQHYIRRQQGNIGGYREENLRQVFLDYMSGLSGSMAKLDATRKFHDALQGIDKVNEPEVYEYASRYTTDMLRNRDSLDNKLNALKTIPYVWYISMNLRLAATQMFQNGITAYPILSRIMQDLGVEGHASTELAKAMKDLAGNMTVQEQAMLQNAYNDGETMANFIQEIKGDISRSWAGKYFTKFVDLVSYPFAGMERFNRKSSLLAAFRVALRAGQTEAEAYETAKEFVRSAHYAYGLNNFPQLLRDGTPFSKIAGLGYVFKSFPHNYVLSMIHYTKGKDGKLALGVLMRSLAALTILGGLGAAPFIDDILDELERQTGYPARSVIRKSLEKVGGPLLASAGMEGILALVGLDMSGSTKIQIPIPGVGEYDPGTIMMGVYGGLIDKGKNAITFAANNQWMRAVESAMPAGVESAIKSHRLATEGLRTATGKPILDKEGKPIKAGPYEVAIGLAGFRPQRIAEVQKERRVAQNIKDAYAEKRKKIIRNMRLATTPEERQALSKDIQSYNLSVMKYGKIIPRIGIQSIKQAMQPERGYMEYERLYSD